VLCCTQRKSTLSNNAEFVQSLIKNVSELNHGFKLVDADAKISVDLKLNDSYTAEFLELLFFT